MLDKTDILIGRTLFCIVRFAQIMMLSAGLGGDLSLKVIGLVILLELLASLTKETYKWID
jgi:hypothetical protein